MSIIWLLPVFPNQALAKDKTIIDVTLTRHTEKHWAVDLEFSSPQSFMVFPRSANNYREKSWLPADDGVHLKNINGMDAIWFDEPRTAAKFIIGPKHPSSQRTLTPAMIFGDGSIMFSSDEFVLFPADNYESVAALWGNVRGLRGQGFKQYLKVDSAETIVVNNRLHDRAVVLNFGLFEEHKVYVGKDSRVDGDQYSGIMDSAVPEWFATKFDTELSQILSQLEKLWGVALEQEIIAYIAYDAIESDWFSYHGTALDEQTITLQIKGNALDNKGEENLRLLQWVMAHEGAHIYQRQNNLGVKSVKHAWIVEGAADAMTNVVLHDLGFTSDDFVEKRFREKYEACADTLNGSSAFGQATSKSKFYDCGELFARITESALPDHNIFEFWNVFLKSTKGRQYDSKLYFKTMRKLGADKDLIKLLKLIVEDKIESTNIETYSKDYSAFLTKALIDSGLNVTFDDGGNLQYVSAD